MDYNQQRMYYNQPYNPQSQPPPSPQLPPTSPLAYASPSQQPYNPQPPWAASLAYNTPSQPPYDTHTQAPLSPYPPSAPPAYTTLSQSPDNTQPQALSSPYRPSFAPLAYNAQPQAPPPIFRPSAPPPPRLLHIYHEGFSQRHASILDSTKRALFTIDIGHGFSKPHVKIYSGASSNILGTIVFHYTSSTIDTTIRDQDMQLTCESKWTGAYSFASRVTGGIFKWKSESKWSFDLVCVDEREVVVARFESGSWAVSKLGMIELAQGVDGGLLEEIIVSGVAMIQLVKMTKNMTMGGIAGGAGGG